MVHINFQKNFSPSRLYKFVMMSFLFSLMTTPVIGLENGNEESATREYRSSLVQNRVKIPFFHHSESDSDSSHSSHKHRRKHRRRGPPGPTGPTGAPGPIGATGPTGASGLLNNFLSSYNVGTQPISDTLPHAVAFSADLAFSGTITRSLDGTQFTVTQAGAYLIGWTLSTPQISGDETINISLFNVTVNSTIPPDPNVQYIQDTEQSASGQTIVFLPANTTVELRVTLTATSETASIAVQNPTIYFTQVGS